MATSGPKCTATTVKGLRCKNRAKSGGLCGIHLKAKGKKPATIPLAKLAGKQPKATSGAVPPPAPVSQAPAIAEGGLPEADIAPYRTSGAKKTVGAYLKRLAADPNAKAHGKTKFSAANDGLIALSPDGQATLTPKGQAVAAALAIPKPKTAAPKLGMLAGKKPSAPVDDEPTPAEVADLTLAGGKSKTGLYVKSLAGKYPSKKDATFPEVQAAVDTGLAIPGASTPYTLTAKGKKTAAAISAAEKPLVDAGLSKADAAAYATGGPKQDVGGYVALLYVDPANWASLDKDEPDATGPKGAAAAGLTTTDAAGMHHITPKGKALGEFLIAQTAAKSGVPTQKPVSVAPAVAKVPPPAPATTPAPDSTSPDTPVESWWSEDAAKPKTLVELKAGGGPIVGRENLQAYLSDRMGQVNYTDAHKSATRSYSGISYSTINGSLRKKKPVPGDVQKTVKGLDAAFAVTPPLDRSILVSRGVKNVDAVFPGLATGKAYTDHGYMSTSMKRSVAKGFGGYGGKPAVVSIRVPAGARAIAMTEPAPPNLPSGLPGEGEVLFPRGSTVVLRSVTVKDGIHHIEADLVLPGGNSDKQTAAGPADLEAGGSGGAASGSAGTGTGGVSSGLGAVSGGTGSNGPGGGGSAASGPSGQVVAPPPAKAALTLAQFVKSKSKPASTPVASGKATGSAAVAAPSSPGNPAASPKTHSFYPDTPTTKSSPTLGVEQVYGAPGIPPTTIPAGTVFGQDKVEAHMSAHSKGAVYTSEHKTATRTYSTASGYKSTNGVLRAGKTPTVSQQKTIDALDSAIASTPPLDRPVITHRGIRNFTEIFGDVQVGDAIHDKGFMSTSTNPNIASHFATKHGHDDVAIVNITIPNGARAAAVMPPAPPNLPTSASWEREVLLPRGSTLQVTKISYDANGVRHVEVTVVTEEAANATAPLAA